MSPEPSLLKTTSNSSGRPSVAWWGVLPVLAVLVTGALLSWHSLGDRDIWFHLRSGNDILGGQGISSVNRYSFTEPDHPWVNHEWMFQILAAATGPEMTSVAMDAPPPGVAGWNLLRSALVLTLLLLVLAGDGGCSRLFGRDGPTAAAWSGVPMLAGLFLLWPRMTMRPELFSYIFLVLLVRWVEEAFHAKSAFSSGGNWASFLDPRRPAGRLFFLTVVWAQFHGFASVAPLIILLGGLLAMIPTRPAEAAAPGAEPGPAFSRTAVIAFLAVLALILTPSGWNGLLMPVRALGQFSQSKVDLTTTISELVPLRDSPNSLGLTITLFQASLVWGIIWIVGTFGRISFLRLFLFACAAWATFANQRSIGLYAVAFMLLHTGTPIDSWRFPRPRKWPRLPGLLQAACGLVLTAAVLMIAWPRIMTDDFYLHEGVSRRFGSGLTPAQFPIQAARSLGKAPTGRYFANIDAAAFMMAHVSGRNFIDARTEAYSPDLWAEYLAIKAGDDQALRILAARGIGTVSLAIGGGSFDRLANRLLESPDWNLWTAEGAGLQFRTGTPSSTAEILSEAAARASTTAEHGSPTRRADQYLAAGNLFGLAGNADRREAAYRKGLAVREEHPILQHNLGNLLMDRKDFGNALPMFLRALEINPRLAGSALNAGVCQMRLGHPDQAEESFERAADMNKGNFEAWANLAAARMGTGNRSGAAAALKKALEIRPMDTRLQQLLKEMENGPDR